MKIGGFPANDLTENCLHVESFKQTSLQSSGVVWLTDFPRPHPIECYRLLLTSAGLILIGYSTNSLTIGCNSGRGVGGGAKAIILF